MKTTIKTSIVTKLAVAIAVVSVAGIVAAGFGFKFKGTKATIKIIYPVDNSTILASEKLKIDWKTNVPSGKGLVDIYLTRDTVTAPYDSQYNEITTEEYPVTPVLWSIKGVDASKKTVSDLKYKTGEDILKINPSAIVPGTDGTYKIWTVLKKQPSRNNNAVVVANSTVKITYGRITSITANVKDGEEKYWGEDIPFTMKYNFPEKGVARVYLVKNENALNPAYLADETGVKITEAGEGTYKGKINLKDASDVPAGEYTVTASWTADSCREFPKGEENKCAKYFVASGPKINVSAPITVMSKAGKWTGGEIKCGAKKNTPVSLAKFAVVNENNIPYGLYGLTVDITSVSGSQFGVRDIYLADEKGVKIVGAYEKGNSDLKSFSIKDETYRVMFDLSNEKIGAKATKKFQIMVQPAGFSEITDSISVKISEFLAGKSSGNKPATLSPDPLVITPKIYTFDGEGYYKDCPKD